MLAPGVATVSTFGSRCAQMKVGEPCAPVRAATLPGALAGVSGTAAGGGCGTVTDGGAMARPCPQLSPLPQAKLPTAKMASPTTPTDVTVLNIFPLPSGKARAPHTPARAPA